MTRDEFIRLRDFPNKSIVGDIVFTPTAGNPDVFKFEKKLTEIGDNSMELSVNGTYKKQIPSLTFNFKIRGVGPICRFDINGTLHRDSRTNIECRTHKHSLQSETCPPQNLPHARERTDFDLATESVSSIWERICKEANIDHDGHLIVI